MLTTDSSSSPPVRLVGAPNIIRHPLVDLAMPEGVTVGQLLDESGIDPRFARWCHVEIDGTEIPAEWWDRVKPKAGRTVTVSVVPEGGGDGDSNKALRTVLLVVVMVAAAAATWWAAGLGGWAAFGAMAAINVGAAGLTMGTLGLLPPSARRT